MLVTRETVFQAGTPDQLTFEIRDDDGDVVTDLDDERDAPVRVVVVRRDLTQFQHHCPSADGDGTWSLQMSLPKSGVYRAFADVCVDGQTTTLGTDLFVPGEMVVDAEPDLSRERTTDAYETSLHIDEAVARRETTVEFEVCDTDGTTTALEPHLGADGHLVALREGDLAYLRADPVDSGRGTAAFRTTFPTPARYRLFLQAKPGGCQITVPFDVRVSRADE